MAAKTRIKHLTSSTTNAPTILKTGEIGYSYGTGLQNNGGDRLYIGIQGEDSNGIATEIVQIGGQYYTDMLDHAHGSLQASSALITDPSSKLQQLKVDNLDFNGNAITSTDTNGNIVLDPNGAGKTVLHNPYVNTTATGGSDVALDEFIYDTVGGAVTGGTGITVTNSDVGNTSTVSITDQISAGSAGSATQIPVITFNAQGQLTTVTTANVATALTVDGDTGTGSVDLLTDTLEITGTSNEIVTAASKSGTDVTVQVGLPDDVTIGNDLTVTTDLDVGSSNFTVAGATGNTTIAGNLTVQGSTINLGNDTGDTVTVAGNLVVQGTTTTVESTTIALTDPVLQLADDTTSADGLDRGVRFKWYDGSAVKEGFFGFDIQSERFVFTKDEDFDAGGTDEDNASSPWHDAQFGGLYAGSVEIGTSNDNTITTSSGNLTIDSDGGTTVINDTVDLNGSLDVSGALTLGTDLAVAHGGTGLSSFTANAVFISNGAGTALSFVTGSEGEIIQFNSSGVPVASDIIDGGTY